MWGISESPRVHPPPPFSYLPSLLPPFTVYTSFLPSSPSHHQGKGGLKQPGRKLPTQVHVTAGNLVPLGSRSVTTSLVQVSPLGVLLNSCQPQLPPYRRTPFPAPCHDPCPPAPTSPSHLSLAHVMVLWPAGACWLASSSGSSNLPYEVLRGQHHVLHCLSLAKKPKGAPCTLLEAFPLTLDISVPLPLSSGEQGLTLIPLGAPWAGGHSAYCQSRASQESMEKEISPAGLPVRPSVSAQDSPLGSKDEEGHAG